MNLNFSQLLQGSILLVVGALVGIGVKGLNDISAVIKHQFADQELDKIRDKEVADLKALVMSLIDEKNFQRGREAGISESKHV